MLNLREKMTNLYHPKTNAASSTGLQSQGERMRRTSRFAAIMPLTLFLCTSAHAQATGQAIPASASPAVPKVVLIEGTEIKLTLLKDLKSGGQKVDEVIPFEVERDVYSPFPAHVLLIPASTPAFGHITKSSRRGMLGKPGKLDFTCDYVKALDGTKVSLRSDKASNRGRSNAGANVAAVLLFAPGYLLINGRDITVHKGTEFVSYSDEAVALTDPRGDAAPAVTAQPVSVLATSAVAVAPSNSPSKTLFTLKDGTQIVGALADADGTTYTVTTAAGTQKINIADVASMHALGSVPTAPVAALPVEPAVTAAPTPPASTPASPAAAPASSPAVTSTPPPPAPGLPVIKSFPQKARIELTNGNSYFGNITAFDGNAYTLVRHNETMTLYASSVKTLELQP